MKRIKKLLFLTLTNIHYKDSKLIDYNLWKECLFLIGRKEHLTDVGLKKILSIKGAINWGLPNWLQESFPNIIVMNRPDFTISDEPLNPHWISGFIEGEGCFYAGLEKSGQLRVYFIIGLNEKDKPVLLKIQHYLENTGKIYEMTSNNAYQYKLSHKNSIDSFLIKHFDSYQLVGNKLLNYNIWKDIFIMYKNKLHLIPEGLDQIKKLIAKLNI